MLRLCPRDETYCSGTTGRRPSKFVSGMTDGPRLNPEIDSTDFKDIVNALVYNDLPLSTLRCLFLVCPSANNWSHSNLSLDHLT